MSAERDRGGNTFWGFGGTGCVRARVSAGNVSLFYGADNKTIKTKRRCEMRSDMERMHINNKSLQRCQCMLKREGWISVVWGGWGGHPSLPLSLTDIHRDKGGGELQSKKKRGTVSGKFNETSKWAENKYLMWFVIMWRSRSEPRLFHLSASGKTRTCKTSRKTINYSTQLTFKVPAGYNASSASTSENSIILVLKYHHTR